jgi:phosphatidylinositol glycan class B
MEGFLSREIGGKERAWPRYVVGFEGIEEGLKKWYEKEVPGYTVKRKWETFNSHWHDDWRRTGDVVVWEFVEKDATAE